MGYSNIFAEIVSIMHQDYAGYEEKQGWDNSISRLNQKTEIDPLHGKGIQPDIYIKWTPKHIEEDIDLQHALKLINKS
ncbi:hypothetical protein [Paenibacillus alvei]|uniref:Uncharacterized protein n=1 Tax=Paenibacillus alvei TaxID=44250 RepID=A0A383R8R4_PAEAL|nr:hypothetical protein [Paenibacillus alvei]SYX83183.1 conserved protein of unknown function [Paenibacillus alvei]